MAIPKKIETAANIVIVLSLLFVGGLFLRSHLRSNSDDNRLKIGDKIPLQGMETTQYSQTLLLGLQKGCKFCEASVPFYRRLATVAAQNHKFRRVAVLPQDPAEAKQYLSDLGVEVDEVRQAPLQALKIEATPTLLLLDSSGTITKGWVGLLTAEQQGDVLAHLQQ